MTIADGELLFVHLSDIHFGAEGAVLQGPNAAARDRTLEDLADGFEALGRPDAILVTGDIAFGGKSDQYAIATEFLELAAQAVGIESARVQVVPGNHDVDWDKVGYSVQMVRAAIKEEAVYGDSIRADELLHDYLVNDQSDPLFAPMDAYQAFAARYDCHVSGEKPYWDQTFKLGKHSQLLMRGLTTSLVSDKTDIKANLLVGTGQAQIRRPKNAVAMALAHHPPDWWAEADLSLPMMRDIVSLALFGHKHTADVSMGNNCVTIVAGAVNPERHGGWHPEYNWLRLALEDETGENPALKVSIWPRRFDQPRNRFMSGGDAGGWEPEENRVGLLRFSSLPPVGLDAVRDAGEVEMEEAEVSVSNAIHELPENVVRRTVRTPLEAEDGEIEPRRNVLYDFFRLGYVQRQQVMLQFELLRDGDDELTLSDLQVAVVERAKEQGTLDALIEAVAELVQANDGTRR